MKKRHIAFGLFFLAILYIVLPYFFEKKFFLNEILAFSGFLVFTYKGFKIERSLIVTLVILLIGVSFFHAIISVFRADSFYYYLRNLVIAYSMFSFFLGYFLFPYLKIFLNQMGVFIKTYVLVFLIIPVVFIYDRFGMSVFFPLVIKRIPRHYILLLLALLTGVYSISYESSTILILSAFYLFLFLCRSFLLFKITIAVAILSFTTVFIYLLPYLSIEQYGYSHFSTDAIWMVIRSHPILEIDPNSTWRLVIWKQIIVDLFPSNILGIGFGTPALKYFPIEDYSKLSTLPYVLGAHNSFIYLFGRLGIAFVILIAAIYSKIFKEFFLNRSYYYSNLGVLFFYSFFAISSVAIFNPSLETPIYASSYWLFLGFLAKVVHIRESKPPNNKLKKE